MKIYKSCTPGITNKDVETMTGLCSFVGFERLLTTGIKDAIRLKPTERIKAMVIDFDGITCYLETKK